MKFFKLKSSLFGIMFITMLTVFLSSCEKDKKLGSSFQIQAQKELEQLEARIAIEATFTKEVKIKDDETGLTGTFAFHTNVPELLTFVTENSIKLKLGEVEVALPNERDLTIDETDDGSFVPIDLKRNIVKLELLNVSLPNQETVPTFSFKFENELRLAIKQYDAVTITNANDNKMSRGCSNGRSSVKMTSDGKWDFKKAHVRVYYRWNNCNFLQCREGKFYSCLTSKVTNTGAACNDAYISSIIVVNSEPVWRTYFQGCNASC